MELRLRAIISTRTLADAKGIAFQCMFTIDVRVYLLRSVLACFVGRKSGLGEEGKGGRLGY